MDKDILGRPGLPSAILLTIFLNDRRTKESSLSPLDVKKRWWGFFCYPDPEATKAEKTETKRKKSPTTQKGMNGAGMYRIRGMLRPY